MIEPLRDKGRLEHILSAIARVEEFTSGISKEQLVSKVRRYNGHSTYNHTSGDCPTAIAAGVFICYNFLQKYLEHIQKLAIFAASKINIMDTTINNSYSVEIPLQDLSLFKEMIVRMGWKLMRRDSVAIENSVSREKQAISIITAPWPSDGLSDDEFVGTCMSGRNSHREIIEL